MTIYYNAATHQRALALAREAMKEGDYNRRRSQMQAAVKPLFDEQFSQVDCEDIWKASQHRMHLSISPSPSNFVQRLNAKTCAWIVATHGSNADWPTTLRDAFINGPSFGNPSISKTDNDNHMTKIQASTTAAAVAAIPALPNVPGMVDLLDLAVAAGTTAETAVEVLHKLYPNEAAAIEAAKNLRAMRGDRKDELPTTIGADVGTLLSYVTGKAEPPKAEPKKLEVDAATAKMLNDVLKGFGMPEIGTLVDAANSVAVASAKAQTLEQQVADLTRKLAMRPVAAEIEVKGTASIPNGKIVTKMAADVFGVTDPKRRKLFEFDVPVGEWDGDQRDAKGELERSAHPHVPDIDDDFIFAPSTLVPVLLAIMNNEKPWLRGHTGTGKTTLIEQVAARLNLPVYRVNLDSDISRSELVGRDTIKADPATGSTKTEFVEGIIPRVMQEPCFLLLDEIDASRPDLAFVLQRLMEGKGFMLLEDGGRTIRPHPWFRMFATANTNGRGDETGLYTGTRVLGSAFVNRFGPFLMVDYIDPKSEVKLLKAKAPTLPPDMIDQIVGYAKEARVAFTQGQVGLPCSPRDTMQLARTMVAYLGLFPTPQEAVKLAMDHVIMNAADVDDATILRGIADRTFKVGAGKTK